MGKYQKCTKGETWASFALEIHLIELLSKPIGARSVEEEVYVEHEMQSDSDFRHGSDGIVTESPGA